MQIIVDWELCVVCRIIGNCRVNIDVVDQCGHFCQDGFGPFKYLIRSPIPLFVLVKYTPKNQLLFFARGLTRVIKLRIFLKHVALVETES